MATGSEGAGAVRDGWAGKGEVVGSGSAVGAGRDPGSEKSRISAGPTVLSGAVCAKAGEDRAEAANRARPNGEQIRMKSCVTLECDYGLGCPAPRPQVCGGPAERVINKVGGKGKRRTACSL